MTARATTTRSEAFDRWQEYARTLSQRAHNVRSSMTDRARALAEKAGLDPSMPFLHAHNAMVSYDHGHPWKGVDYRYVRQIQALEKRLFDTDRKAGLLKQKAWHKFSVEHLGYKGGNFSRRSSRRSRSRA
jgi:hypothetical protein